MLTTAPFTERSSYASGELGLPGSPGDQPLEPSEHDAAASFDETFMALVADQPQRTATPSGAPLSFIDMTSALPLVDVAVAGPEAQHAELPAAGDDSNIATEDGRRWWDTVPEEPPRTGESATPPAQPRATIDAIDPPRATVSGQLSAPPRAEPDRGVPTFTTPAATPETDLRGSITAAAHAGPRPDVNTPSPFPAPVRDAVPEETAPELSRVVPRGTGVGGQAPALPGGSFVSDGMPAPPPNAPANDATDPAFAAAERRGITASAPAGDPSGGTQEDGEKPSNQQVSHAARRFSARLEGLTEDSDQRPIEAALGARSVNSPAVAGDPRVGAAPQVLPATAAAPLVRPAEPSPENLGRLIQTIRVQARGGVSEATVTLQPEHLGEVTIAIRLDRGSVSAVVRAEAANVCEWLRGQEESIRNGLSDQGLQLERFIVQRDRSRERREPPPQPQGRPRGRRDDGPETPRFDVAA